jgi:hypothetical protein
MTRHLTTAAAVLVVSLFSAAMPAQAQFGLSGRGPYAPAYRPGLSPYLNLLRGGDPAANYFLGTLPEFSRRSNAIQFRSAIQELDDRVSQPAGGGDVTEELLPELSQTGHPTAFNNLGSYFGSAQPTRPVQQRSPVRLRGARR